MFSLKDSVLIISPATMIGNAITPRPGTPVRMQSHTSVTIDPGGKQTYIKGAKILPISIVTATAEPKFEIDFSDGPELWSARNAMGGIGSAIIISLTFARTGMTATSFSVPGTWSNGGGLALDESNGSKPDKLSVMCLDVLQDLRSIYNPFS